MKDVYHFLVYILTELWAEHTRTLEKSVFLNIIYLNAKSVALNYSPLQD